MPAFMSEWYRAHPINDLYRDIRARVDEDYKKLTSASLCLPLMSLGSLFVPRFGIVGQ